MVLLGTACTTGPTRTAGSHITASKSKRKSRGRISSPVIPWLGMTGSARSRSTACTTRAACAGRAAGAGRSTRTAGSAGARSSTGAARRAGAAGAATRRSRTICKFRSAG